MLVCCGLAVALAYVNGFHDASNSVSTSIATRTMRERTALAYAALLNLLGALLGLGLASLTAARAMEMLGLDGGGAVDLASDPLVPSMLIGAAIGAILWSIATWALGSPSSSWQAAFAATAGSALALGQDVRWGWLAEVLLLPLVIGPLLAGGLAYGLARGVRALGAEERLGSGALRSLQTVSAGAVAVGHGMIDIALPAGLLVIAGAATGTPMSPASWPMLLIAVALGLGTLAGGRRIIRTISRRLTNLTTVQGFAAEVSTALLMAAVALGAGAPLSTSYTLSSSVVGAGLAFGPRQIRWKVLAQILTIWALSPLAALGLGATATLLAYRLL